MKKNKNDKKDIIEEALVSYNSFEKEFFPSQYENRKKEASLKNGSYYTKLARKIVYHEDELQQ